MSTKVKLGDKITFTHTLRRTFVPENRSLHKKWIKLGVKTTEGVIVGIRTLNDGYLHGYGEDSVYMPSEYIRAYLVAYDLRKKPVYVKIEEDENRTRN